MDVLLSREKKKNEIKLGDIFLDEDDEAFLLLNLVNESMEYPYTVRSFCGTDWWNSYKSLEDAQYDLSVNIKEGRLTHYSQDEWQLELKRK